MSVQEWLPFAAVGVLFIAASTVAFDRHLAHVHIDDEHFVDSAIVHFSPNGGCTRDVTDLIESAQDHVRVQAYDFTSEPITQALLDAAARGVDVQLVLDKSNLSMRPTAGRASPLVRLFFAHARVLIDSEHAIQHSKVIVVDGRAVLTGSFNFTHAAETRNAENCLTVRGRDLASEYEREWWRHEAHSKRFEEDP